MDEWETSYNDRGRRHCTETRSNFPVHWERRNHRCNLLLEYIQKKELREKVLFGCIQDLFLIGFLKTFVIQGKQRYNTKKKRERFLLVVASTTLNELLKMLHSKLEKYLSPFFNNYIKLIIPLKFGYFSLNWFYYSDSIIIHINYSYFIYYSHSIIILLLIVLLFYSDSQRVLFQWWISFVDHTYPEDWSTTKLSFSPCRQPCFHENDPVDYPPLVLKEGPLVSRQRVFSVTDWRIDLLWLPITELLVFRMEFSFSYCNCYFPSPNSTPRETH